MGTKIFFLEKYIYDISIIGLSGSGSTNFGVPCAENAQKFFFVTVGMEKFDI